MDTNSPTSADLDEADRLIGKAEEAKARAYAIYGRVLRYMMEHGSLTLSTGEHYVTFDLLCEARGRTAKHVVKMIKCVTIRMAFVHILFRDDDDDDDDDDDVDDDDDDDGVSNKRCIHMAVEAAMSSYARFVSLFADETRRLAPTWHVWTQDEIREWIMAPERTPFRDRLRFMWKVACTIAHAKRAPHPSLTHIETAIAKTDLFICANKRRRQKQQASPESQQGGKQQRQEEEEKRTRRKRPRQQQDGAQSECVWVDSKATDARGNVWHQPVAASDDDDDHVMVSAQATHAPRHPRRDRAPNARKRTRINNGFERNGHRSGDKHDSEDSDDNGNDEIVAIVGDMLNDVEARLATRTRHGMNAYNFAVRFFGCSIAQAYSAPVYGEFAIRSPGARIEVHCPGRHFNAVKHVFDNWDTFLSESSSPLSSSATDSKDRP